MEEQELKQIWRRSSKKEEITINPNTLIVEFKRKMEQRERIVRRRDLKETIAAIFAVILYTVVIIKKPFSISSIGGILMILAMINVVIKLYNNRKSKFAKQLFLPVKEQLLQQRAFMLGQAKLLRNVLWLFLPVFVSYLIFEWGNYLYNFNDSSLFEIGMTKRLFTKLLTTLFMIAIGCYVTIQNRRAAKVNWEPLISDINTILENLDKEKK